MDGSCDSFDLDGLDDAGRVAIPSAYGWGGNEGDSG
jgi:hypothetical protein